MNTTYTYLFLLFVLIQANIQQIDVQQDERVQLECMLKTKSDVDGVKHFLSRSIFPACLLF